MGSPSVPTSGKAETASVPWVELTVAGAMGVVTVLAPKVTVTVTPGTKVVLVYVYDPPRKPTVLSTVYVPSSVKVCVPVM